LSGTTITGNQADGGGFGIGVLDGTDGLGQGGGVFLSGPGSTSKGTRISGDSASTNGNDVYGTFT
jgi:hypothetical protein